MLASVVTITIDTASLSSLSWWQHAILWWFFAIMPGYALFNVFWHLPSIARDLQAIRYDTAVVEHDLPSIRNSASRAAEHAASTRNSVSAIWIEVFAIKNRLNGKDQK